jgi:hypothetical protein
MCGCVGRSGMGMQDQQNQRRTREATGSNPRCTAATRALLHDILPLTPHGGFDATGTLGGHGRPRPGGSKQLAQ